MDDLQPLFALRFCLLGHGAQHRPRPSVKRFHFATIRPCGTSTSSTPRKENKSFTRYVGGFSETWRTIVPTASVTAAWKTTEPTRMPARFTRTCGPSRSIRTILALAVLVHQA